MNITHRQTRALETTCRLAQWGFLGMAAWMAVSMVFVRRELREPDLQRAATASSAAPITDSRVSLEQLQGIWQRNLRQPLIAPKPKAIVKPKPAPAPPPVKLPKLLATFVEQGQAWGLFVDAKGNQRVRTTGGKIDGLEIVKVEPGGASLRQSSNLYHIEVPRKKSIVPKRRSGKRR